MSVDSTEVFFRPEPVDRNETTISAALYNRCRLTRAHSGRDHLFIPIRAMQYLAVVDEDEIIFVDSQAYAVRGGEGGRIIVISWHFRPVGERESLNEPVPMEILFHHEIGHTLSIRLQGEFDKALADLESRQIELEPQVKRKKVIEFPG